MIDFPNYICTMMMRYFPSIRWNMREDKRELDIIFERIEDMGSLEALRQFFLCFEEGGEGGSDWDVSIKFDRLPLHSDPMP